MDFEKVILDKRVTVNGKPSFLNLDNFIEILSKEEIEYLLEVLKEYVNDNIGGTYTDLEIKTKYENNINTNAFTNSEQTNLSNQSGTNTGDQDITGINGTVTIHSDISNAGSGNIITNLERTNLHLDDDVESLNGNLVNNTDPRNPIINTEISSDVEQMLVLGTDDFPMLDPDNLISADLNNILYKGTDNKLSILNDSDWLKLNGDISNDINDDIYTLGNVGIGTFSPSEQLDITNNIRVRGIFSTGGNNTKLILPDDDGTFEYQILNEGQVKINSSNGIKPSKTNFISDDAKFFYYDQGTLDLSSSPTTQFPYNQTGLDSDIIDPITFHFLENPVTGSVNIWRVDYTYSGKGGNSNLGISVGFMNPLSSFVQVISNTLPSGTTQSPLVDFGGGDTRIIKEQAILITIADNASIGTGYKLFATSTQSDTNFTIEIDSVTRLNGIKLLR